MLAMGLPGAPEVMVGWLDVADEVADAAEAQLVPVEAEEARKAAVEVVMATAVVEAVVEEMEAVVVAMAAAGTEAPG